MTVDVDSLPPTQYLILDVLAARHRLGEHCWTFPDRLRQALDALTDAGLIEQKSAPTPRATRAWLTDAGRAAVLSERYVPPLLQSNPPEPAVEWPAAWSELTGYVQAAVDNPSADDAARILAVMRDLKRRRNAPIGAWIKNITDPEEAP